MSLTEQRHQGDSGNILTAVPLNALDLIRLDKIASEGGMARAACDASLLKVILEEDADAHGEA